MGRPAKYPWRTWFQEASRGDGKALKAGVHYAEGVSLRNFRNQIYQAAIKHGFQVSVSTRGSENGDLVSIRAIPVEDLSPLFDGDQHTILAENLPCPAYEYVGMLQTEAQRRGLGLLATADDLGNVIMKSQAPS